MTDNKAHRPAVSLPASLLLLPVLCLGLALGASAAQAAQAKKADPKAETKRIGKFTGWDAYEHTDKGAKLCYLHAQPQKKEPASAKRGEIYILVTHKPKEKIRNEVSIYFGYPLKEATPAQAVIGGTTIEMFTHQEAAWAADATTDQKLVDALRKGKTLVVKGESSRGTKTTDTYDLDGFTQALQAIDKACGVGATS
ncbi:invasion associated locus B family protein [Ferrovibrio sp.]|uniref:invasion associated locus B family protein n=1 Tax=Ferrovibrio sp. TaxID=1917215 RepID=UPI0025B7AEB7|nr:invasion associated locus B family protein [Ferrovibrio sp.]